MRFVLFLLYSPWPRASDVRRVRACFSSDLRRVTSGQCRCVLAHHHRALLSSLLLGDKCGTGLGARRTLFCARAAASLCCALSVLLVPAQKYDDIALETHGVRSHRTARTGHSRPFIFDCLSSQQSASASCLSVTPWSGLQRTLAGALFARSDWMLRDSGPSYPCIPVLSEGS